MVDFERLLRELKERERIVAEREEEGKNKNEKKDKKKRDAGSIEGSRMGDED